MQKSSFKCKIQRTARRICPFQADLTDRSRCIALKPSRLAGVAGALASRILERTRGAVDLQNSSFVMQNPSFLIHNFSFLIQNSSFLRRWSAGLARLHACTARRNTKPGMSMQSQLPTRTHRQSDLIGSSLARTAAPRSAPRCSGAS